MRTSDGYRANMAAHLVHATDKAGRDVERMPPPLVRGWWGDWSVAMIVFAAILIAGTIYARYFS